MTALRSATERIRSCFPQVSTSTPTAVNSCADLSQRSRLRLADNRRATWTRSEVGSALHSWRIRGCNASYAGTSTSEVPSSAVATAAMPDRYPWAHDRTGIRSETSELDRRPITTVHRIMPGPDGTSSANAGALNNVHAAANVTSNESRSFMVALSECGAASTPLTDFHQDDTQRRWQIWRARALKGCCSWWPRGLRVEVTGRPPAVLRNVRSRAAR